MPQVAGEPKQSNGSLDGASAVKAQQSSPFTAGVATTASAEHKDARESKQLKGGLDKVSSTPLQQHDDVARGGMQLGMEAELATMEVVFFFLPSHFIPLCFFPTSFHFLPSLPA
jgi:hypothetical protein